MRLSKARKEFVTAMMKDAIYKAAGSVLQEHGVNGVTMDRVATTAGLAKGSLYNYFEDKDTLLGFVCDRLVEPFFEAIEEIGQSELPASQKLAKILRTSLQYSDEHKAIIRLLAETRREQHEIRRRTRPRFLRLLTSIFDRGILDGDLRPHDTIHTARMFLGCLSELFELQAEGSSSEEANQYAGVLIDAVLNGFSIHTKKQASTDEERSA
ncbi:MAG: TetR/AcrR family transcriptional regulator [Thermoguttaceae bacterium]